MTLRTRTAPVIPGRAATRTQNAPPLTPPQRELVRRLDGCLAALSADVDIDETGRVLAARAATGEQALGDQAPDNPAETGAAGWRYHYDDHGDLARIEAPDGAATHYRYDTDRRLQLVLHGDGRRTRYHYDDRDRLVQVEDGARRRVIDFDDRDRIVAVRHGRELLWTYRHDDADRVVEAAAPGVRTRHRFDDAGQVSRVEQVVDGVPVAVEFTHDDQGRLTRVRLEGGPAVGYGWDDAGRPATVTLDGQPLAAFGYDDTARRATTTLANGVVEETRADRLDGRPLTRTVRRGDVEVLTRRYSYDPAGRVVDDGHRHLAYDEQGRLREVTETSGRQWWFGFDRRGNLTAVDGRHTGEPALRLGHDGDRLTSTTPGTGTPAAVANDAYGAVVALTRAGHEWVYRYDAAGHLVQVRRDGHVTARLSYDHKGRLVLLRGPDHTERYVYGLGDELLAVTDAAGVLLRLPVRSPLGVHAHVVTTPQGPAVHYLHHDDRGTLWLATDAQGQVLTRYDYDPYGLPLGEAEEPTANTSLPAPVFAGRPLVPGTGMYYFGARWHHPWLRRFLTPDSWTAAPDDERLVHPAFPGRRQALARGEQLPDWLARPGLRQRYAYCGHDPVNRADPNGHWSFGGVVLSLLGALWTLPNTLFGLVVELSCLVAEVLRWLAWAVTLGRVSWEPPGFDLAASGRLNAFAMVFRGGWLGSFPSLLGITFGNVFFVYGRWEDNPGYNGPGDILPTAYQGKVRLPLSQSLYEHELRHTNQYGWLGPFFHLGLPLFGFYEWDVILHGYRDAWTERDARAHAEGPPAPVEVTATDAGGVAVPQLGRTWVYWRHGGTTQVLRTQPDGLLRASLVPGSDRPADYTQPFTALPGTFVDVAASRGAKPLPADVLATPGLFTNHEVVATASGAGTIEIPRPTLTLEAPSELSLWPLLWEPPTPAYATTGLPQGEALWNPPDGPGSLTVTEGSPAPAAPANARPATRWLRLRGQVDATTTAGRIRLINAAGQRIPLAPTPPATTPVDEVPITLGAPTTAGTRGFEAVLKPADAATAFGPVQVAVLADTPAGPAADAFTVHLCGLQLGLVDDTTPTQPGAVPGEADEAVVVDFDASPQAVLRTLSGQTRARRMVRYRIANEPRVPATGGTPTLRPRMPLWMGEVQLVGLARTDLEDLLGRRAERKNVQAGTPTGPQTTRLSFDWRLRLSWDGPDANSAMFAAPFPRPGQRHNSSLTLPHTSTPITAVLSYDSRGRLTDPTGAAAPTHQAGTLEPAPTPATFPVPNRRLPSVRLGQRPWGRTPAAAALPALVVEFQPLVADPAGAEILRGGDGELAIVALRLDGTPVDPGMLSDPAGTPRPTGANDPTLALPRFRVIGQNAPAADVEATIRALVADYVTSHATAAHIRPLTQQCWETTVLRILRHESGGQYRQFDDRGAGRRRFTRQGGTWFFGTEQDMPLFGPPHGYGIGQLDFFSTPQRGANDDEVWNWVENLRAAVQVVLAEKAASAWALIGQHAPTPLDRFTRAVFQRELVRRYNGGTEFTWTGTTWAVSPSLRWAQDSDHSQGPHANLLYPNQVLGTGLVYYRDAAGQANRPDGADTQFAYPPPIAFGAAQYTPETA